jgi:hypothetical protein
MSANELVGIEVDGRRIARWERLTGSFVDQLV